MFRSCSFRMLSEKSDAERPAIVAVPDEGVVVVGSEGKVLVLLQLLLSEPVEETSETTEAPLDDSMTASMWW